MDVLPRRRQLVRGGRACGWAGGRAAGRAGGRRHRAGQGRGARLAFGNTGGQGGTGTTARLAPASSIIYTAQLTVRAGDVSSAVAQAAQIAEGAGGYVSSETAKIDPDHPSKATASVQLKIPVAAYPTTTRRILLWLLCGVLSLSPSTLVASHIWPSGAGSTVRSLPYAPLKNVWKFVSELPLITAR